MRCLIALLCLLPLAPTPALAQGIASFGRISPAAEYVTAGQDESGYRAWYAGAGWRPVYVRAFHDYLVANGVGGVAPTWQLLRTATLWRKCGAQPFEVPPTADWQNIVATLRFIGARIVPTLGPIEPVSVYRNPALNVCAGGAETSTHREMGAVDVVPLRPIGREALMTRLCAIHAASPASNIGLGFYKGVRFHIDARKYREWGTAGAHGGHGCTAVLAEGALPFDPATPQDIPPPVANYAATSTPRAAPATSPPPAAPAIGTPPVDTLAPLGR